MNKTSRALKRYGVCALLGSILFSAPVRVFAAPSSSSQMRDTEKQRAARLRKKRVEAQRARREIAAIYGAMAASQQRGDLSATRKYFAPDVQIVTENGARLGAGDLARVLALPAPAMRLESVQNTITDFVWRGALASVKIRTNLTATSQKNGAAKSRHFTVETLRRETWRRDQTGWKLTFSKTMAQITRAQ